MQKKPTLDCQYFSQGNRFRHFQRCFYLEIYLSFSYVEYESVWVLACCFDFSEWELGIREKNVLCKASKLCDSRPT